MSSTMRVGHHVAAELPNGLLRIDDRRSGLCWLLNPDGSVRSGVHLNEQVRRALYLGWKGTPRPLVSVRTADGTMLTLSDFGGAR